MAKFKLIPAPPGADMGAQVIDLETGKNIQELVTVVYRHEAGHLPELGIWTRDFEVDGDLITHSLTRVGSSDE